nr:reverse transcriptase domain-containing protein [Tanacetum cinerariifolium]
MNQKADVLSKLTSVAFNHLTKEVLIEVLNERSTEGLGCPGSLSPTMKRSWEEYNEEDMCLNLDLLQERRETPAIREA